MLAFITVNNEPVTYVRGSKSKVVSRAKELVAKLNKRETEGVPSTLVKMYKDNSKFSFKIFHSVDELK